MKYIDCRKIIENLFAKVRFNFHLCRGIRKLNDHKRGTNPNDLTTGLAV